MFEGPPASLFYLDHYNFLDDCSVSAESGSAIPGTSLEPPYSNAGPSQHDGLTIASAPRAGSIAPSICSTPPASLITLAVSQPLTLYVLCPIVTPRPTSRYVPFFIDSDSTSIAGVSPTSNVPGFRPRPRPYLSSSIPGGLFLERSISQVCRQRPTAERFAAQARRQRRIVAARCHSTGFHVSRTRPRHGQKEIRALHQSLIRAHASVNPIQSFSRGAIPWPPVWVMVCMNASARARCTNEVSH
ncbi:hypothetical protein EDB86DRAFT_1194449 [Lactarius hatsudake]|nr:hypothetical protein EDB86DRAFT_1194449 [Lactarius hatsudake]